MPNIEILLVRNCIHITVIFYFHLEAISVSLKILGLKLAQLECIIKLLDPDTNKKARNELDGSCGLSLVKCSFNFQLAFAPKKSVFYNPFQNRRYV